MIDDPAQITVFVIIETPYDGYRIRTVCYTKHEAEALCAANEDETEYPLHIHKVVVGAPWVGFGYDDGYEADGP